MPRGCSPARKLPALTWPQAAQALSPVRCAQPGSHVAILSICVAQVGKTSSFPPGKANSLMCCKCTLCTPKSIATLTMTVFEKLYSCQAVDRYTLPCAAEQGQETATQMNRAAPCPRSQPPLLLCQRHLRAPSPNCFRKNQPA